MEIIAEIGLAHLGSLDIALKMLPHLKDADVIKTQAFDPDSRIRPIGRGLSREALTMLCDAVQGMGKEFILTPHDWWGFQLAQNLGLKRLKIGHGATEAFAEQISERWKGPIIRSSIHDLWSEQGGYTWLFTTDSYPTASDEAISAFKEHFTIGTGWSDHTGDDDAACLTAVARGAEIIEKHVAFLGLRSMTGRPSGDLAASMDVRRFGLFCKALREARAAR